MSKLMESAIQRVGLAPMKSPVVAFPFMRLLICKAVGATLAPHFDLCCIDHASGRLSTHTFVLDLTSNDESGETESLLGDISGKG